MRSLQLTHLQKTVNSKKEFRWFTVKIPLSRVVIKDRSFVFGAVIFLGLTESFQGPKNIQEPWLCSSHWGLQGWLSFSLALAGML